MLVDDAEDIEMAEECAASGDVQMKEEELNEDEKNRIFCNFISRYVSNRSIEEIEKSVAEYVKCCIIDPFPYHQPQNK